MDRRRQVKPMLATVESAKLTTAEIEANKAHLEREAANNKKPANKRPAKKKKKKAAKPKQSTKETGDAAVRDDAEDRKD